MEMNPSLTEHNGDKGTTSLTPIDRNERHSLAWLVFSAMHDASFRPAYFVDIKMIICLDNITFCDKEAYNESVCLL